MKWRRIEVAQNGNVKKLCDEIFALKLDLHKQQFLNIGTFLKPISGWQLIFKSLQRPNRTHLYFVEELIKKGKEQGKFEFTK